MPTHVLDPACTSLVVGKRKPVKALTDRFHAGKAQHASFETAHSVCTKIPTIKQGWHPHCDDDAGRTASEQPFRKMGRVPTPGGVRGICHRKARAENVFQKSLQERRHGSVPERKCENPMLRPTHIVLRTCESRWNPAPFEIFLRPQ